MPSLPPQPLPPYLVELFDQHWDDPRQRDDRSNFQECMHCGRAVRWIVNRASAHGGRIPIVARPVATGRTFDREHHVGLVAVDRAREGWTVGASATRSELDDLLLYVCHWDVCEGARAERVRFSRLGPAPAEIDRQAAAALRGGLDEATQRYARWRDSR